MKISRKSIVFVILVIFVSAFSSLFSQEPENADKSLSPYFLVQSDNPNVDQLPLKETSADVNIAGVIADVKVTQVYKNEGKNPIEAIYIFPASTRAAVYAMKMTIGKRIIEAKIQEREKARQQYEQAKQEGKSASLLEQQRPNVFQMNVANILSGDVIKVEMSYTELLVPTDGIYEFIYPTVVGPRYTNQTEAQVKASEKWVQNPYLHEGEKPNYSFDIKVNLSAGIPIQEVTSPSHKVNVNYDGPAQAAITLDQSEKFAGNKDYILKYKLSGGKIESGLLLYKGKDENFFLMMIEPPAKVSPKDIPPREYVFIMDVSGSMNGYPIDISKKLLSDLISNLRTTDKFNVVLFAGGSSVLSDQSIAATKENIAKAVLMIDQQQGGGGTELLPALKRALELPKAEGCSRTVVIATDGYVNVEEDAFDLIRNNLGKANMFAFGIGTAVNRFIIEGIAHVGMGEPFIITKPEEAPSKATKFRELVEFPVLTQINLNFNKFKTYDIEPQGIPDVLAERPVIVFGKWKGEPQGMIDFKGFSGKEHFSQQVDVSKIKPLDSNSALRYLWARHKITIISDYNKLKPNDERIKEVTNLGLKYNLLTAYTSFVAIDSEIRLKDGKATTVKQPLPLPEGVSDLAVGGYGAKSKSPSFPMMMKSMDSEDFSKQAESLPQLPEKKTKKKEDINSVQIAISIADLKVEGGLIRSNVKQVIKNNLENIKLCLSSIPKLIGKVKFEFTIGKDGSVSAIKLIESRIKDSNIEACIENRLKALKFKSPSDGKDVKVTVTFKFEVK